MRSQSIRVLDYNDRKFSHLKYVVNYYEGDGESRKRKRRFFKRKDEANTFADEQRIKKHNDEVLGELPADDHLMALRCRGALSAFGKTIQDATNFFIAHLKASEKSCSAVQLVRELVAAKEKDGASVRHVNDLRSRLNVFAAKFDGQPVATITSAEIDDWLRSLPVSSFTRNRYRALTVLAFNFALRRGYATANPAMGAAKAKFVGKAPGILTVTETARLLEAASPDILPYLAIGAFAGLRRAELERLHWDEVDFQSGLIEVKAQKSKTAMRRFVAMQPNLREWLLPLRKHKGGIAPDDFNKQFVQAREAAGIGKWPENALRHSFASYHLAHFKNAASTALELGHHDSRITFACYRQLVKPTDAERYWAIRPVETKAVVQFVKAS